MIKNLLLIILFLLFFLFMGFYLGEKKKNKKINENIKTYAKQYFEEELKSEWQTYKEERRYELEKELNEGIRINIEQEQEKLKLLEELREFRRNEIDHDLQVYREERSKAVEEQIEEAIKQLKVQKFEEYQEYENKLDATAEARKNTLQGKIDELVDELFRLKAKRDAINEANRREKQIQEQQDFYRVVLSDEDLSDLKQIKAIIPYIKHPDAINKLMWDVYVKKGVDQVIRNVLNNESFAGIYKFTNINTNESYIGKSTDVKKRAYEHYKYAYGLSGIASSYFHSALIKDGVENFTFELLEKCDKDKLTEREKYYIDFYETKTYGYNQRLG